MFEISSPEDLARAQWCLQVVQLLWPDQKDVASIEDRAARLMSVPEELV